MISMGGSKSKIAFEICVVTGDFKQVDMGPAVHMVMFDERGNQSPTLTLDNLFQLENDLTQAKFTIDQQSWSKTSVYGKLHHIEFWRVNAALVSQDWFLDKVIIRDRRKGMGGKWEYFFFPVHRWIQPDTHHVVHNFETFLPKDELYPQLRETELTERQNAFVFCQRAKGLPVELENDPADEIFTYDSRWDTEEVLTDIINRSGLAAEYNREDSWDSFDTLGAIYRTYNITEPLGLQHWIMNDICFGAQRIKGCNPFVLRLCRQIPENFGVVMEWIKPQLEGWTVKHILEARRLYYVDYQIMDGLDCKPDRIMCAPMALFFFTEKRQLKPIAIQLQQEIKEGNPVFISTDSPHLWMQAKLWFNMVDACHHLIAGRLLTHLILESLFASMRRNLAQSHPIYQLIAPHFRSTIAVCRKLKHWAFDNDGWIARNIQLSKKGIKQLLRRAFKQWRFDVQANIHKELQSRGVYDTGAFPNYPYRDDALCLHKALEAYVLKFVRLFYPTGTEDLLADPELQSWRHEVASPMEDGGLGIKGVPGGVLKVRNGAITPGAASMVNSVVGSARSTGSLAGVGESLATVEDTTRFLTGILYLSIVVAGSALRLPMYDEYGFPANYPISLSGLLPQDPLEEHGIENATAASMEDVLRALPNRRESIETLLSIRLAAKVPQSVLGRFDSDYVFDPRAIAVLEEFRTSLGEISAEIQKRNEKRDPYHQYYCMDPALVPNYPGL